MLYPGPFVGCCAAGMLSHEGRRGSVPGFHIILTRERGSLNPPASSMLSSLCSFPWSFLFENLSLGGSSWRGDLFVETCFGFWVFGRAPRGVRCFTHVLMSDVRCFTFNSTADGYARGELLRPQGGGGKIYVSIFVCLYVCSVCIYIYICIHTCIDIWYLPPPRDLRF